MTKTHKRGRVRVIGGRTVNQHDRNQGEDEDRSKIKRRDSVRPTGGAGDIAKTFLVAIAVIAIILASLFIAHRYIP